MALTPAQDADYAAARHLSFAYHSENVILPQLSMRLVKGQTVGVIGPSGAGKSTIIKMICKFYSPSGGELSLFGHEAERWSHDALREHISLVTQDSMLFSGTILENVRYGREDATEDEVIAALEDAQLWDYVRNLPEGIHTVIGEFGETLSGGQRQRLAIARAIVKNAELILLDEPTSDLDTLSERELQAALDRLLTGKTALIVAHRLSTLSHADFIYSLDGSGRVIEAGSPAELMAQKGYYYQTRLKQDTEGEICKQTS